MYKNRAALAVGQRVTIDAPDDMWDGMVGTVKDVWRDGYGIILVNSAEDARFFGRNELLDEHDEPYDRHIPVIDKTVDCELEMLRDCAEAFGPFGIYLIAM